MTSPLYEHNLLKFRSEGVFASVKVIPLDYGTCSEWWVSHNSGGNLLVIGNFMIPILADRVADAERKCAMLADGVMEFAVWSGNGLAGVPGSSDGDRRGHCLVHLQEHFEVLERAGGVAVERTCALYRLALGFNINNPAALIAQAEGLGSVKTVHERLAYGRRLGLLNSPGKGRRR